MVLLRSITGSIIGNQNKQKKNRNKRMNWDSIVCFGMGARVKAADVNWLARCPARPVRAGCWLVGWSIISVLSSGTELKSVFTAQPTESTVADLAPTIALWDGVDWNLKFCISDLQKKKVWKVPIALSYENNVFCNHVCLSARLGWNTDHCSASKVYVS